ncbi:MAG: PAS domain S-box protein [Deltaproteobacteria bacterium]|nr:PAS domain S-box protein [Deltaproteobacteria bacterium]
MPQSAELHEALQMALDAGHLGIWRYDAATDLTTFSERAARIFGLRGETTLKREDYRALVHPEDREPTRQIVDAAVQQGVDYEVEFRVPHADGKIVWVLARGRVVTRDGKFAGLVGVMGDVTERRKAEQALRASEEFNRTIVTSSRDCFKTLDLDGRLLWISDVGPRLLGVTAADLVGTRWLDIWKHDVESARAALEAARVGGTGQFVGMLEIDGEPRWWDVVITPILDSHSAPATLLAVSRDVTERRKLLESERLARENAERASAIKDEFLATLSHELRTPLNAILGWAHLLRRKVPADSELVKGVEIIERNARAQTRLIEDLLDMSRIAAGKVRLDMQPIAPFAFVEAAVEAVRPAAAAKNIELLVELDPSVGSITGDAARLQQVVLNVLSNAIKFTPQGGHVEVRLDRHERCARLRVIDDGAGIHPDFLPYVFERFRQADSTTTRHHGGLGLGLAIVKHLVELHGGSVAARSDGLGKGATFTLLLPSADEAKDRLSGAPRHVSDLNLVDLRGLRVLVVDDEHDACALVAGVLGDCGAEVITATSALRALTIIESECPHVLVSDIGMPEVDGFELLRRVRSLGDPRGRTVPAIALTAFARPEDRTKVLRAGFVMHLSKPVDPTELAISVASASGRAGATET